MTDEEFFKNEGVAIFMKGKFRIGIHPMNLENNCKALDSGDMKINWMDMLKNSEYIHVGLESKIIKRSETQFTFIFFYQCPNCSNDQLKGGSKYCDNCGTYLSDYKYEREWL